MVALQAVGELDREIGALAQLAVRVGVLLTRTAGLFEGLEQPVEVSRQELLAESRIDARPRELVLGYQVAHYFGL